MFRACLILSLAMLAAAVFAVPVSADEARVALVVGVSAYRNVPRLPNTVSDARDIAAALARLDFEVETVTDPDRASLEAAVRKFGRRAQGAATALFFYAGHALELGGRNWLVPVQADLHTERDLRFETLELDAVLEQIDGQARVALIVLDACRDNPFRRTLASATRGLDVGHGLAPQRATVGTLLVYATAPGNLAEDGGGSHSPFTAALLRHIETPGLEVRQLVANVRRDVRQATNGKQIPWDSSALEGPFFFRAAAASPPPSVAARPSVGAQDAEVIFWDSIKASDDPEDLRAYLSRYPNGTFAALARNRLARLPPPKDRKASVQPPNEASAELENALQVALSMVGEQERIAQARRYVSEPGGRALAVAPIKRASWRVRGQPNDLTAAVKALEGCQIFADEPCVLIAIGDRLLPRNAAGNWTPQPQARVAYTGEFDPAQIPAMDSAARATGTVTAYRAISGPKAMALHPWGRVYVNTGTDQVEAESTALRTCNDDPDRKGANGPCFLYAAGDQVVLPERHTAPTAVTDRIVAAAARVSAGLAEEVSRTYRQLKPHKAVAIEVTAGRMFRWDAVATASQAEQWALEGCQQTYNKPCVLLAVDDDVRSPDPRAVAARPMQRLAYRGPFRVDMLPWNLAQVPGLIGYPGLPGAKAIAVRPRGARVAIASGKASHADAEREALAQCNMGDDDPSPCFLYASDMQVVLAARRTQPAR